MVKRIFLCPLSFSAIVFIGGMLSAGTACAHDPRFACSPRPASNPVRIADVSKSWAFYGRLDSQQRDYYTFAVASPVRVPIDLLVDGRDAANPGRPSLTLSDSSGRLLTVVDLRNAARFYEPFSRVSYLSSGARLVAIAPGRFSAVVSMSGAASPQRYVFAIGSDERFGIWEIPYVAGAIYRIHSRKF